MQFTVFVKGTPWRGNSWGPVSARRTIPSTLIMGGYSVTKSFAKSNVRRALICTRGREKYAASSTRNRDPRGQNQQLTGTSQLRSVALATRTRQLQVTSSPQSAHFTLRPASAFTSASPLAPTERKLTLARQRPEDVQFTFAAA